MRTSSFSATRSSRLRRELPARVAPPVIDVHVVRVPAQAADAQLVKQLVPVGRPAAGTADVGGDTLPARTVEVKRHRRPPNSRVVLPGPVPAEHDRHTV
jgi:hypothetical protein